MSATPSVALPTSAAGQATAAARHSHRLALLFVVIVVTSIGVVAAAVAAVVHPIGDGRSLPGYTEIEPIRNYIWTFHNLASINLLLTAFAIALAAWILTPQRGARCATAGGALLCLGAAVLAVGVAGSAWSYFYATHATLGTTAGAELVDRINHDDLRAIGVPVAGAVMLGVGSLLLAVALWRAHTVPRWVPVLGALTTVATVLITPTSPAAVVAEGVGAITSVAIGWYAWRRYDHRPDQGDVRRREGAPQV